MTVHNKKLPLLGLDDHDSFSLDEDHCANLRNVRMFRNRIVRAPGGTLLAGTPTSAGYVMKTGSFVSPSVIGNQTITHNLGVAVKAILLFSSGAAVTGSVVNHEQFGLGFTDLVTSRYAATATLHNSNPSQAGRRYSTHLLAVIDDNGSAQDQCDYVSSTTTTFTINWTIVTTPRVIFFVVIGGAAINAKVLDWTLTTASGDQAVTGVGFAPQVGLHICSMMTVNGGSLDARAFIGAAAAAQGWSLGWSDQDNVSPSVTRSIMARLRYTMAAYTAAGDIEFYGYLKSLDADGYTIQKTAAPAGAYKVATLFLNGFTNVAVDVFTKTSSSAPATQAVTGVGFQPDGLLSFSNNVIGTPGNGADTRADATLECGASDGILKSGTGIFSQNGVVSSKAYNYASSAEEINEVNSDGSTLANVGKVKSFDSDGFTFNWTNNDTTARLVAYIALHKTSTIYDTVGTIRNFHQTYVNAALPVEKVLMLTHKSAFIYNGATNTWTSTAEAYTGGSSLRFSVASTQGLIAYSQGVDNLRQWDGTTFGPLVTSGTNHAARGLLAFADRFISVRPVFGGVEYATQIRWPVNGAVNNWNGTGSGTLEIIETSQDPLTGQFVLGSKAYLSKRWELIELIWTGTLSPVFRQETKHQGQGILARHSVAAGEDFVFFLGPDEIYAWDGSSGPRAIGDKIYHTIKPLIDFQNLDQIQGVIHQLNEEYWLVIPPWIFIYDYRRDVWHQDDVTNFSAIGSFKVDTVFTTAISQSQFVVLGDSNAQTIRSGGTSWLGNPIDSYFETKDYTAEELMRGNLRIFSVNLWDWHSLREVRFQSTAGNVVEVGVSTNRGSTWTTQNVTVNAQGVGVAWYGGTHANAVAFSSIRFRFRSYSTGDYDIHGSWAFDSENAGYQGP